MKQLPVASGVEESEIHVLDLLHVVVKHKRFIIKLCAATAIISAAYSLTLPNIYTATATVLPPQKEGGGGLSALIGQSAGMGALVGLAGGALGSSSSDLYIGILRSRSVADGVVKKLDLTRVLKTKTPRDASNALRGRVKMQAGKEGIITITAEDTDPKLAAALANAFVDQLGRKSIQMNLTKAGNERVFLEKRLEVVKEDLKKAEESMKSFQEKNKTIKIDNQAMVTMQGIAQMKAELISKEVQLATQKSYQTDENPQVKQLQTAIARLRGQLGAYEGRGVQGDPIPSIGNIPNLGLEYARRMRDLKIQEALFEQLTRQYEVAKISEAKDSSSMQVLDEAIIPTKRSKPSRSLIVIVSTIVAFFVGVFAAFARNYIERIPEEDKARWQEIKTLARVQIPWKR